MTSKKLLPCLLLTLCTLCACSSDASKGTAMEFGQLPIAVRRGVESEYPDSRVQRVLKRVDEKTGAVQYKVKVIAKDGDHHEQLFAADGTKVVKE